MNMNVKVKVFRKLKEEGRKKCEIYYECFFFFFSKKKLIRGKFEIFGCYM